MKIQQQPIARIGSALNWIVVNPDGHLLAVLDSESEAHFFTTNRGHANGAIYFKTPCDYAAAPQLLAALKACEAQLDRETLGGEALDKARAVISKAEGNA